MEYIIRKISQWDRDNRFILKKMMTVLLVVALTLALGRAIKYVLPFVFGYFFASLIRPLHSVLARALNRVKRGKTAAAVISMFLFYGLIALLASFAFRQIYAEGERLVKNIPQMLEWVEAQIRQWVERIDPDLLNAPEKFYEHIDSMLDSAVGALQNFLSKATPQVASSAISTVSRFPMALLFTVMAVMSSYYFLADREKIRAFFERTLPHGLVRRYDAVKGNVGKAVLQQIKAQVLVSMSLMATLVVGFWILRIEYALLLGSVIGALDVLPIIGAGTFLIPWGLFALFAGQVSMGLKVLGMYVVVVLVRQIIEPRIVGKKLGLYPLVSMVSMYIGLKFFGFLGLIFGPVLVNICKVVLETETNSVEK